MKPPPSGICRSSASRFTSSVVKQWGYPEGRARIAPAPLRSTIRDEHVEALGRRRFERGAVSTAAGGNNPQVQIFLPSDSKRVVVVDLVIISSTTSQAIQAVKTGSILAASSAFGFGARGRGIQADAVVVAADVALLAGDTKFTSNLIANIPLNIPEYGEVLDPGEGMLFLGATINTVLTVTYFWREYRREEVYQV